MAKTHVGFLCLSLWSLSFVSGAGFCFDNQCNSYSIASTETKDGLMYRCSSGSGTFGNYFYGPYACVGPDGNPVSTNGVVQFNGEWFKCDPTAPDQARPYYRPVSLNCKNPETQATMEVTANSIADIPNSAANDIALGRTAAFQYTCTVQGSPDAYEWKAQTSSCILYTSNGATPPVLTPTAISQYGTKKVGTILYYCNVGGVGGVTPDLYPVAGTACTFNGNTVQLFNAAIEDGIRYQCQVRGAGVLAMTPLGCADSSGKPVSAGQVFTQPSDGLKYQCVSRAGTFVVLPTLSNTCHDADGIPVAGGQSYIDLGSGHRFTCASTVGSDSITFALQDNGEVCPPELAAAKLLAGTGVPGSGPVVGASGDPQFVGLQGQSYQVHGAANVVFNLISTPSYLMNGLFTYIESGSCSYNNTQCWTHPGTYIGELGFVVPSSTSQVPTHIRLVAGAHSTGPQLQINGQSVSLSTYAGHTFTFASSNSSSSSVTIHHDASVTVTMPSDFRIHVTNSDYFFNMAVRFTNSQILTAGRPRLHLKHAQSAIQQQEAITKLYPVYPLHGLLGQTWKNVVYANGQVYQGDVMDYALLEENDLFGNKFMYSQYGLEM